MVVFLFSTLFVAFPILILSWILIMLKEENQQDRVIILLYHRLISKKGLEDGAFHDNEPIYASFDTSFEEQMRYLKDNDYITISFDDYVQCRNGLKELPRKPVIVTFDDGYESNYRYAYPILRKYGLKATIFVTPFPDERTRKRVEGIDSFLSAEQIREMSSNGIAIESHALTHRYLTDLSLDEVRRELVESKKYLENITGKPVRFLAIPSGAYNREIRRIAQEVGYTAVCGNKKGTTNKNTDLFCLKRIVIERDFSLSDFAKCFQPVRIVIIRMIGYLKKTPRFLLGVRRTEQLRDFIYRSSLGKLFLLKNLRFLAIGLAVLYVLLGAGLFYQIFGK